MVINEIIILICKYIYRNQRHKCIFIFILSRYCQFQRFLAGLIALERSYKIYSLFKSLVDKHKVPIGFTRLHNIDTEMSTTEIKHVVLTRDVKVYRIWFGTLSNFFVGVLVRFEF